MEVNLESLFARICVRPPYFALRDVRSMAHVLEATASAELAPNRETGPIQAAELGRHGAIAGLCAAAWAQPDSERRFYLARQALYHGFPNPAPYGFPVRLRAELVDLDKRQARSTVTAEADSLPLARIDVVYSIVAESAFARMFRAHREPTPTSAAMSAPPAGELLRQGGVSVRVLRSVPLETCAGHFDEYPALPVAVIMSQLADLAGCTLPEPQDPYRVTRAEVDAQDLCWAGESAKFEARLIEEIPPVAIFECTARASNRHVGGMRLWLERADPTARRIAHWE